MRYRLRGSQPSSEAGSLPSFCVVTQYFPPERGAAQVRLGTIVELLRRRGHHVEVVTAIPNYPTDHLLAGWSRRPVQVSDGSGVRVIRVWVWAAVGSGFGRVLNYASFAVMSLLGLARSMPADWTFIEYPSLPGALPAFLWCRLLRRQVIVNVADLWVDAAIEVGAIPGGEAARLARRLERWLLRRADVVTAVTEGLAEAVLAKGVEPHRMGWLPNGVDTTMFAPGAPDPSVRSELGVPDGHQIVLYAGTHGYVHALDVVLDAAARLGAVPVTFVLVGDGSEKAGLQRRAREAGLTNVVFADSVPPERVADYLRVAVAGLAAVRSGPLYRSVRSAKMLPVMASGIPLLYVAEDEGAAIVQQVGAGVVTPPGDGAALAAAVRRLLEDPDARTEMGRRGRAYALEEGNWEGIVEPWLDFLAGVDGGSGR